MKLNTLIPLKKSISELNFDFFIAEDDFIFKGLPILKNSLVYKSSELIMVNRIPFSALANFLRILDIEWNYITEKVSNCDYELTKLDKSATGLWHKDHFDDFINYDIDINKMESLKFNEIKFSSLWYSFDLLNSTLESFINLDPLELDFNNCRVKLPKELEIGISFNESLKYPSGINKYFITPINKVWEYFGVKIKSLATLDNNGILSCNNSEEFNARIHDHKELNHIIIGIDSPIDIYSNGKMLIELFDEETHQLTKYRIKKIIK